MYQEYKNIISRLSTLRKDVENATGITKLYIENEINSLIQREEFLFEELDIDLD